MKPLPEGEFALSIAHPGHELRLYGFMEQAKPFIFILTDGGLPGDTSRMEKTLANLGSIYGNTAIIAKDKRDVLYTIKHKKPENGEELFIKDYEILREIEEQKTDFFDFYIKKLANSLLFNKVDYVIMDAPDDTKVHTVNTLLTHAAINLINEKTGKKISLYEFNVSLPFNTNLNEECIKIELDEEMTKRKIKYILFYHPDVFTELKQNLPVDLNFINRIAEMKDGFSEIENTLLSINADFFKYEYLRPASSIVTDSYMPLLQKLLMP